jgi:hypothetical protein
MPFRLVFGSVRQKKENEVRKWGMRELQSYTIIKTIIVHRTIIFLSISRYVNYYGVFSLFILFNDGYF